MISVSYHLGFHILKKLSVFFVGEILHPGDPKKKKEACVIHTKACLFLGQGRAGQGRTGEDWPKVTKLRGFFLNCQILDNRFQQVLPKYSKILKCF